MKSHHQCVLAFESPPLNLIGGVRQLQFFRKKRLCKLFIFNKFTDDMKLIP